MDYLNENSGAVQAIGTAVLTLVTILYVVLTRSISKSTARAVEAAQSTAASTSILASTAERTTVAAVETAVAAAHQARASMSQAEEARRIRALSVLPVLVVRLSRVRDVFLTYEVVNQGLGPAVSVRVQWAIPEKSGGPLLEVAPAIRPGESVSNEIALTSADARAVAAAYNDESLRFRCLYMDVLGGAYESETSRTNLAVIGANQLGRLTVGGGDVATP